MAAVASGSPKNVEMKELCVSMKKKNEHDSDEIMDAQVGIEKARARLGCSFSARVHVGKAGFMERMGEVQKW